MSSFLPLDSISVWIIPGKCKILWNLLLGHIIRVMAFNISAKSEICYEPILAQCCISATAKNI